jgi:hypothetical protein
MVADVLPGQETYQVVTGRETPQKVGEENNYEW